MRKKILIVSTVGLIYDGITNVILSYLEAMDRSEMDIYVVSTIKCEAAIRSKIERLDGHVVDFPSRRENTVNYFFELVTFVRAKKIDVIHAHGNSGTLAIEMVAGWLGGCKKRIAHSHNTKCDQVKADKLLRPLFNRFYTDALACGNAAGQWLFGSKPFTVLINGRDTQLFSFNKSTRNTMRSTLELTDQIAIGHVGGFFEQKNHRFLIEVFREILKTEPTARFFLIGDGPLKNEIEVLAEDIKPNITFVGTTPNVADYLQAMDVMVLPSLFEGVPLVAIEWQINGLPCVFADTITRECVFTENITFLPLETDKAVWAETILAKAHTKYLDCRDIESVRAQEKARNLGFDISVSASELRDFYLEI